ncbi:MAG TPA: hypothetical protein VLK84_01510, partial [Longimicrobium sp.]|nr:hypothetical protein [Longimicrobium sp.]
LRMEMQEQGTYHIRANGEAVLQAKSYDIALQSDPQGSDGETVRGRATNPGSGFQVDFTVIPGAMGSDVVPAAVLAVTMLMDPSPSTTPIVWTAEDCRSAADKACGNREVTKCELVTKSRIVMSPGSTKQEFYQECTWKCGHVQGGGG